MADDPLLLRLPPTLVEHGFYLDKLLNQQFSRPWSAVYQLRELFLVSGPERRFVRKFLRSYRNWWLFRCNQAQLCGDFIAVDMSSPQPRLRPVVVIELKQGQDLRVGGGGAGNQFQRSPAAVATLVTRGVIDAQSPITLVCGDQDIVLAWIASGRPA